MDVTIFREVAGDVSTSLSSITERLRGNILDLLDQVAGLINLSSLRLLVRHVADLSNLRHIIICVISLRASHQTSFALSLNIFEMRTLFKGCAIFLDYSHRFLGVNLL